MYKELLKHLENKKIVILGFGREGKSTYKFLRKNFPTKEIDVIDENIDINSEENLDFVEDMNLNIIKTSDYFDMLNDYDYIFKTPGISFKNRDISKIKDKLTSQLDMFLTYYKKYTTIIGITGTKGKSTTSSMIYKVLKEQNKKVHFLGNIGIPLFNELENINKGDYVVLEISSHQAQYITNSPNIAVILNVFEEHLDHYNSYEEYIDAKINVVKFQEKEDFAILNKVSNDLNRRLDLIKLKSHVARIAFEDKDEFKYFDFKKERNLLGIHNDYNIMVVLKISEILKLDKGATCNTIYSFEPLEHRLEKVGVFDGVIYYNDSISTIPEATISCVNALKNVNTLIIGGMDRGIHYESFEKFLIECNVENIICMYDTGKKIYDTIKEKVCENKNIIYAENLKEAVKIAKKVTKKDTICALSPAAASYGVFKNFEERGKFFKDYIRDKNV